jgi:hypothetical protein
MEPDKDVNKIEVLSLGDNSQKNKETEVKLL